MDTGKEVVARAALKVMAPFGFALAGGNALAAHGLGERPSDDIDLFTVQGESTTFEAACHAAIQAWTSHGWTVVTRRRVPFFAQFQIDGEGFTVNADIHESGCDIHRRASATKPSPLTEQSRTPPAQEATVARQRGAHSLILPRESRGRIDATPWDQP